MAANQASDLPWYKRLGNSLSLEFEHASGGYFTKDTGHDSNKKSLSLICREIVGSSPNLYAKWHDNVIKPVISYLKVEGDDHITTKIGKCALLILFGIVNTLINLIMIPFYTVELIFDAIGKIFTAPEEKYMHETRLWYKYTPQIFDSGEDMLLSIPIGVGIGIAASLVDIEEISKVFFATTSSKREQEDDSV